MSTSTSCSTAPAAWTSVPVGETRRAASCPDGPATSPRRPASARTRRPTWWGNAVLSLNQQLRGQSGPSRQKRVQPDKTQNDWRLQSHDDPRQAEHSSWATTGAVGRPDGMRLTFLRASWFRTMGRFFGPDGPCSFGISVRRLRCAVGGPSCSVELSPLCLAVYGPCAQTLTTPVHHGGVTRRESGVRVLQRGSRNAIAWFLAVATAAVSEVTAPSAEAATARRVPEPDEDHKLGPTVDALNGLPAGRGDTNVCLTLPELVSNVYLPNECYGPRSNDAH